ncbi:hypothetical protein [Mucilaginibacter sp.]|uniref:hypothetical protein n=1 Tax=Mucilaginibacter sp. TaxID=1882438 RepID=UPI0026358349|nr:hypothetical protein [Mucilaginibacter sp.]
MNQIKANIPALEDISGRWMNADTMAIQPSIRNFRAQALLNGDMSSISWFASAPYSGGYHSGVLKINGDAPRAQLLRWLPWEGLRKVGAPTYQISSSVRMIPDNDAIMWEIKITNNTKRNQHYTIEQDLIGFISRYDKETWPWPYPYPTTHGKTNLRDDEIVNVVKNVGLKPEKTHLYKADESMPDPIKDKNIIKWPSDIEILNSKKYEVIEHTSHKIIIADTETKCFIAFDMIDIPDKLLTKNSGGTAFWSLNLKPGESKNIRFFMTYAASKEELTDKVNKWDNHFDKTFSGVENEWKARWKEIFEPGNKLFSGCFPTLETNDKAVKKVYYTGPLTLLYLLNTNLPAHKRVFLTGGPRWGATVMFFWDTTEWSSMLAIVDPEMLKEQLKSWVSIDPSKYFGQDNYTGKGVGNGYVANYWALFQLIHSYITITKDYAFLNEVVNGEKIIDHLHDYAYNWRKISIYGKKGSTDDVYKLADFGDNPWNLLECVPTYIHIVPSFNVAYVWMMRETGKFYEYLKEPSKAKIIKTDADSMAKRVLKLYAGNGVWNSLYPDNKKVEVRHVLDFMYFGKYMNNDLPANVRKEMVGFVYRELITDKWMRAQSLQDIAAKYSDRPDHGPLGAYDGWPAGTIDALSQMGYTDKALQFYRSIAPVTNEGIWAQAHELWGEHKYGNHAKVRVPERGWTNRDGIEGIEFSQDVLKDFMGFHPEIDGKTLQPMQGNNFSGKLYHVLYGGKYYDISCRSGRVTMQPSAGN